MELPVGVRALAIRAARTAGRFLASRFHAVHIQRKKSRHEIVLREDLRAERIIVNEITSKFPSHRILSEEAGDNKKSSPWCWVIDPLDGTTNYSFGNPLYATSVALLHHNTPVLSVIQCPHINELYVAECGKGARLRGSLLHVSHARTPATALLTYCHGYAERDIARAVRIYAYYKKRGFDIRQLGCASIEFAWVAKGATDAYISPGANPWDVAPGALLVREAGGVVVDFKGTPWTIASDTALAAPRALAFKIIRDISRC